MLRTVVPSLRKKAGRMGLETLPQGYDEFLAEQKAGMGCAKWGFRWMRQGARRGVLSGRRRFFLPRPYGRRLGGGG